MLIDVSAVIATKDRTQSLRRTLEGLTTQEFRPRELIIVDASMTELTHEMIDILSPKVDFNVIYQKATKVGAAAQRMQGIAISCLPFIWFLDDDIILEKDCTQKIWEGFASHHNVGAVNALITNQLYTTPGHVTRTMYRIMHGKTLSTYAGKVIGPAWNLLPEDDPTLPEYVECEWLNTGCTMYRREALPDPVFPDFFYGYSMLEDLALSSIIKRNFVLLNARTARIFHDSQPGDHKNNIKEIATMSLVNRYFVMTGVLGRVGLKYKFKLILFELFGIFSSLRQANGWRNLPAVVGGKFSGVRAILKMEKN
jgi:GT2 family glycosyltransferase